MSRRLVSLSRDWLRWPEHWPRGNGPPANLVSSRHEPSAAAALGPARVTPESRLATDVACFLTLDEAAELEFGAAGVISLFVPCYDLAPSERKTIKHQ